MQYEIATHLPTHTLTQSTYVYDIKFEEVSEPRVVTVHPLCDPITIPPHVAIKGLFDQMLINSRAHSLHWQDPNGPPVVYEMCMNVCMYLLYFHPATRRAYLDCVSARHNH